jgi:hypothetical protein
MYAQAPNLRDAKKNPLKMGAGLLPGLMKLA